MVLVHFTDFSSVPTTGTCGRSRSFRAEFDADVRRANSMVGASLAARASGLDILFFHGLGNETQASGSKEFYKVRQQQFSLQPAISLPLGAHASVAFGPVAKYATTDVRAGTFLASTPMPVYGTENFGQIGGHGGFELDLRDRRVASARGMLLRIGGSVYPSAWDVQSAFGELHGEVSTYLSASATGDLTLALRGGGKKVWGTFPFHEAAFLGGNGSLRGFRAQRFAGDAALFGNAELRVKVGQFFFLLPGDFGLLGLGDIGRVFLEGESSDTWHAAAGGGLWFAFLGPQNTVSVAFARSRERTEVYARAGFQF